MNNRGSIAVMSAVLTIPLLLFAGLAVDVSRLWLLRQRMQWAVDTAALLGASQANGETADLVTKDAQELFWVSYGAPSTTYHPPPPPLPAILQTGFLGSSSAGATVVVAPTAVAASGNTPAVPPNVTVTASATLPTSIMRIMGTTMSTVTTISSAAIPHKIEMALVLDNSLSMGFAINNTTKLAALQTAANNLLTTILGNGAAPPNVSIAIVPFAGSVNVGNDVIGQSFLKPGTLASQFHGDTTTDRGWRGCVQARAYAPSAASYDTTEDPPSTAMFDPYYSPTTYQTPDPQKPKKFLIGDNDWTDTNINDTNTSAAGQTTDTNYLPVVSSPALPVAYVGPNLFCPRLPLVKLTNNNATLTATVNSMALVNGGGTIMNQGLQWGWFTLSPLWTAWNLPPSQANAARPAAYSDTGTTKVIVMMTDGANEVDGANTFYGPAATFNVYNTSDRCDAQMIYPECYMASSWYTSYGRVSSGVLGTTQRNSAAKELANRFQTICKNIKATQPSGIIIYTIFFHGPTDDYFLDPNAGPALQSCATDANHFFDSQSSTAINAAFQQIAQDINDLKIRK